MVEHVEGVDPGAIHEGGEALRHDGEGGPWDLPSEAGHGQLEGRLGHGQQRGFGPGGPRAGGFGGDGVEEGFYVGCCEGDWHDWVDDFDLNWAEVGTLLQFRACRFFGCA